ncbi:MAG: lysine biosynthesis protein LysX [Chloroflexota bacterium]|nr:lysine biosynthesis protein LysX [Chloroflexota bacterium]
MKIGVLLSRIRVEEKLIFRAAEERGYEVLRIDDRHLVFNLEKPNFPDVDIVLDRGLVHSRAEYTLRILESWGIPTINSYRATITCDNKFLTNMALIENGIPTLRTMLAYTPASALEAIEELSYPVVLKPNQGSWGRLLAKINDRDAAEAVLEHKEILGSYHHSIFYIQEYVRKPGRDIRAFVVGDRVIAASYRASEHWITNTARGGASTACPITPEIESLALGSARAVGADIAGVDLVETDEGCKVIEINVGAEFHGLIETTDTDIAGIIVDYLCAQVEARTPAISKQA